HQGDGLARDRAGSGPGKRRAEGPDRPGDRGPLQELPAGRGLQLAPTAIEIGQAAGPAPSRLSYLDRRWSYLEAAPGGKFLKRAAIAWSVWPFCSPFAWT